MKKEIRRFLQPIMMMSAIISLVFMNFLGPLPGVSADEAKTTFEQKDAISLSVGESYTIKVDNKSTEAEYVWLSNNPSVAAVDQNGLVKAVGTGSTTINCIIMVDKTAEIISEKVIVKDESTNSEPSEKTMDKNGLDSSGRIVAYFGSPVIDGDIDPIWSKAQLILPQYVSEKVDTTATFKALWDDSALYILAEVKDKNLSVQLDTPHMQDSVEIFLNENNDKSKDYGVDDLHIRINYENSLSVDNGEPKLYYTAAKKLNDGYVIETRIALKTKPENGKVLGIELQVNDAKGQERLGSINLFDTSGTAWFDPSKFGEILFTGKAEDDVSGINPYDLFNLVNSTLKLDFKLYKNANVLTNVLTKVISESVLNGHEVTQNKIDGQYEAITAAISKLEMTEEAANEKHFKPIPDDYRVENDKPGKIESLHYKTPNLNDGTDDKKMHVYLPYGYDASATDKKYNVLYLMHGGGENEDLLFGGPGQNKELKKILDNMIAKGDIEPLIVVTPTFNDGKNDVALFHEELIDTIVPLVENKYNTYAKSGSLEDLKASREHRAFGGFSMGSVTTWYTFINALDYFKYYVPLSGDSWIIEQRGGGLQPEKTAEYLANVAKNSGYKPQDYYIFSATGKLDIAYPNLKPQIDAMKQLTDVFIYSSDTKKGNFYFLSADSGTHAWNWQNQYIYGILPDLFSN